MNLDTLVERKRKYDLFITVWLEKSSSRGETMGIGMIVIFIETLGSTFVNKCCQVHHSWHPGLFPSSTFLSIMFLDLINSNNHYPYQICILTITISSKALLSAPWILSNFVLFRKNINVGMAVTPWPAAVSWHWSTSTYNNINLEVFVTFKLVM